MERVQLSNNFFLDEFTVSETAPRFGIDMTVEVGSPVYKYLLKLCRQVLQPTRNHFGWIIVSSGFRPLELNTEIGGSDNSQHIYGQAADKRAVSASPYKVCNWIAENLKGQFDQLIHEFGAWTHVSVAPKGRQPRGEILTAYKSRTEKYKNGKPKTKYRTGILTMDEIYKGDNNG